MLGGLFASWSGCPSAASASEASEERNHEIVGFALVLAPEPDPLFDLSL
jgi:hypothetical protein